MRNQRIGLLSTRLHYFDMVVRTGSLRRAAVALNVAPSAISRSVSQLEDEIGTPLFERMRQRLKLTGAGEILIHHTRLSRAELNKAYELIEDLKGLLSGTVRLAVVESAARGLIPDILARYWRQFPNIYVEIRVLGSRSACEAVLQGECDLALAFDDQKARKGLSQIAAVDLHMGVLVPPDHALARRNEIRMRDLAGERVLMSDASLTLSASIEEAMHRTVAELSPQLRTNSITAMIELTLRGGGIAFQTRVGVEKELAEGKLKFLRLHVPRLRPRRLMLLGRNRAPLSDAAGALKDMIVEEVGRLR
jgi:DNA-binding transcriptional LysR family regulator